MEADKTRQELEALCERLRFLNGCLLRIGSGLDLDVVLQEAADGARFLVGARYGIIVTTDDAGMPQTFTASGLTVEEMRQLQAWEQGVRLFAHLRELGRPIRLTDWPGYVRSIGLSPHAVLGKCFMSVPMGSRGRQFGHFFLADKNDGTAFGDSCEETLTMFAGQVSNAIANARTHSSEQRVRAELEGVLDTAPTGLIVFRRRGEGPPLINLEARRLMARLADGERSAEDILEALDAQHPDGRVIDRDDLLLGETQWAEEIRLSMPDGRSIEVLANAGPLRTAAGEIVSATVALQDLEPVRRRERMYHDFLAMVSHELRTPLSAVIGSASTLLDDATGPDRAEMRDFLRVIVEQAGRMRALTGDLLDVGRIRSGTLSVAAKRSDVRALIERAKAAFTNGGAPRTLRLDLPPDLPPVMADPGRIGQVLGNLLSNAARHAPEGSTIRIVAVHEDPYVAVSVCDEGAGFTAQQARLLFREKASAANGHAGGAGIGLVICKGLVEAHGGRIRAESPGPGRGATFTFTVPVAGTGDEPAGGAAPPAAERPARILVVDDDPDALRFLRDTLRQAGFEAFVTGDHADIPRLLRRDKPELVLLDLSLPGADGIDLLQGLPGLADLPVIIVSGYGREETVAKALDAGAEDYVVKPCSAGELAARVRAALRRRRPPAEFVLGELAIDYDRRRVSVAGRAVELSATEYEVLSVLSRAAGKTVTYADLLRRVWKRSEAADSSLVRMQVKGLRGKLGDDAENPTWIFNQRGVGYRMPSPGET